MSVLKSAGAGPPDLTFHEALSGITGAISLAAWVFLLVPQLLENYRAQSSAAISKLFLLIWFAGDICNLAGAIWAGLVPTVVALGVYFCFADAAILAQCLYYDVRNRGREPEDTLEDDEQRPLLRRVSDSIENSGPPGSGRRASFKRRLDGSIEGNPERPKQTSQWRSFANNTMAVIGVCAIGAAGWAIAYACGWWAPVPLSEGGHETRNRGAELLGYASAVLYLTARIPQIVKNWKDKSCEGLALLFFVLSLIGNCTQGATILFHSVEQQYFLKNLPWLLGSLGTVFEDSVIFAQFRIYSRNSGSSTSAVE